tara:strand:- start:2066 stop:2269 length:204 start_codon:yes stop_codon:yes gene_type:complete
MMVRKIMENTTPLAQSVRPQMLNSRNWYLKKKKAISLGHYLRQRGDVLLTYPLFHPPAFFKLVVAKR